jgi:transcriptional regulator with XRE-family HTH domain
MRTERQGKSSPHSVVTQLWRAHNAHMASKGLKARHFLRAWRKHRGYTLEQMSERIGMSHQNLGKIERGDVPYSEHLLERLAEEYRCDVADLIIRDPSDPDGLWSVYDQLRPVERVQLVEMAKVIKRTGTGG